MWYDSAMTVRLYLDVDGVINTGYPSWPRVAEKRVGNRHGEWLIRWSPDLLAELSSLDVNLVWTTTWTHDASGPLAEALDFDFGKGKRWLQRQPGEDPFPSIHWKDRAILRDQGTDPAPYIWVDDELRAARWAQYEPSVGHKLFTNLIVGPNPDMGITPEHIEKMRQFIHDNS